MIILVPGPFNILELSHPGTTSSWLLPHPGKNSEEGGWGWQGASFSRGSRARGRGFLSSSPPWGKPQASRGFCSLRAGRRKVSPWVEGGGGAQVCPGSHCHPSAFEFEFAAGQRGREGSWRGRSWSEDGVCVHKPGRQSAWCCEVSPWGPLTYGATAGQNSCSQVSALLSSGGARRVCVYNVHERDTERDTEIHRDRNKHKYKRH